MPVSKHDDEEEMKRAPTERSLSTKSDEKKASSFKTSLTLVVNDDLDGAQRKKKEVPSGSDYSRLLSGLYALILIIIGLLFPLSEALQDKWLQTGYMAAFLVYIYSVSTIFLVFVQLHLLRSHHKKHGKDEDPAHHEESKATGNSTITRDNKNTGDGKTAGGDKPNGDHKANEITANHTDQNGNIETAVKSSMHRKSKQKIARHRSNLSAIVRYSSTSNLNAAAESEFSSSNEHLSGGGGGYMHQRQMSGFDNFGETVEEETEMWVDMSKLGNIFSHAGSSFYLRLGSLLFGIGHLIYVALEIENSSRMQPGCPSAPFWWTYIIRLIFILVQTFFLFKNEHVHIHEHTSWARFGFAHLLATNMCVWFRTLINEIMQEMDHLSHADHDTSHDNSTVASHAAAVAADPHATGADCSYYRGILQYASIYLFPFVLEYSLIALGTLSIIYTSIGEGQKDNVVRGLTNFFKVQSIDMSEVEKADHEGGGGEHGGHHGSTFTKSHRGLFTGILVFAGAVVSITLFFYSMDTEQNIEKAELIYLTSDLVLHSILLVAAVGGIVLIHRLSFIAKPVSIDDILLYVSLAGSLVLEIAVCIAAGDTVAKESYNYHPAIEILRLCHSMVAALQTVVQVILIQSGMRRYPSKASHINDMPARSIVTFLVIGNVTVWIFRTMQAKELTLQNTQFDFYGQLAWVLLLNINLPLLLFYRFHSSICLADVWLIAYTPLHQKVPKSTEHHQQDLHDQSEPTSPIAASTLMRSISVPQLYRPTYARKPGAENPIFELDCVSQASSEPSMVEHHYM